MKSIDKEGLKQIIDDMFIEDYKMTRSVNVIDTSTLEGKRFDLQSSGEVVLTIKGIMRHPHMLDESE